MSRSFITFMISVFVIVGALFFFTLYKGSELPNPAENNPGAGVSVPPAPPQPSVVLTTGTSTKGDTITVTWANLPEGTIALDVFRTKKKVISWELWQEISITSSTLAGGSETFTLAKKEKAADYSFYVQAVSENNEHAAGGGTNAKGEGILWTSAILDATSLNAGGSSGGTGGGVSGGGTSGTSGSGNGSGNGSGTGASTSTASSTSGTGNGTGNGSGNGSGEEGGGSSGGGGNAPAPSGTPYYTPEIQISGYGQPPGGSFWVQHIDQKIQIGWQGLPPPTTRIEVVRSTAETGPWSTVLIQQNPILESYSIQVVDDTVGQPYYYELNDYSGSSTIGTYGPIYLPPVGQ